MATGGGVHVEDGSFAGFISANVTGNLGGLDVDCERHFLTLALWTELAACPHSVCSCAIRGDGQLVSIRRLVLEEQT
jgi:hypothetical protein